MEETGGANVLFVTKDGKLVTPKSDSILPSVTRRSLLYVAEHYLGMETEEREVLFEEVPDFVECGLCGNRSCEFHLSAALTGIMVRRLNSHQGWKKSDLS